MMSDGDGAPAAQRQPLARITRGEWALILVLVAIHFTHMVDFVILMPLGKRLMGELGISPIQFGWLVSAYAIAAGLTSLCASLVMDRFDRKAVLLTMYGGFTLSTLFCGLAWNYEALLVARTAAGMFGGLAAVTIMAVIGDVFPVEKRGRAMGAITSSFAVASIAGIPLGLLLAEWLGWGAPFVALAGLSAAIWATAALRLPRVRGHLAHERRHPFTEFAAVVKEGNHQRAFVFTFFLVLGTFTVGSFSAPYLAATNGWGEDELAVIYAVGGVCTLLGMQFVGSLADRFHRLTLFRVLGVVTIAATVAMANLPAVPLWVATAVLSLFMVFSAGRMVPAQAMMLGSCQPRVRGAFMSLNTSVQHLGTAIAPVLAGALITQTANGKIEGYPLVGWVAAAAAVVSLVLAGMLRPAKPEPPTVGRDPKGSEETRNPAEAATPVVPASPAPEPARSRPVAEPPTTAPLRTPGA
jgi:predicted MFS family arabinose efflux permease